MSSYPQSTTRLVFDLWSLADLPDARALWGDPEVMRLIDRRGGLNDAQLVEKIEAEMAWQKSHGIQYWKLRLRDTGEFVGVSGLRPCAWSSRPDAVELGFHFVRRHWGKGFAGEAATATVRHAFETLRLPMLVAGHHPDNVASRRVLEKLGFTPDGDVLYAPTGLRHPIYFCQVKPELKEHP